MCSTPRAPVSIKKIHQIPVGKASISSYAQIMHKASMVYERNQEEKKRRAERLAKEKLSQCD